mgnify:CR=1 FL=1
MSALRNRLDRATTKVVSDCSLPQSSVIPYDCIREYLSSHRMVQLFMISTRDLHSALLYVERNFKQEQTPRDDTYDAVSTARSYDCTECNAGNLCLDTHNGHYVCDNCGIVPHHGTLNVEREWIDGVTDEQLAPRHKRMRYIPGVPKWMTDKLSSNPRRAYECSTMGEMENMNGYMNLTPEMLYDAHCNFLLWTENGYNRDVKMAACMFQKILHSQFLSDADVRCMMRNRMSIPQVADPTPNPSFPCRCGVLHHSKKAARFHSCRH